MRKHASGFRIGAWIVGGLVGLYLLGGLFCFFAPGIIHLPDGIYIFMGAIYKPIVRLFGDSWMLPVVQFLHHLGIL